MAAILNDTPSQNFVIHIGAPKAIVLQVRQGTGGLLRAFDNTLVMRVTYPTGTFDLEVGDGITLSTAEGVASALVTAQLTVTQSRLIPTGKFARYEIQETVSGVQNIILMGALIGKGGENPDV
jgi:hypothetical protein